MERNRGFEPPPSVWKTDMLTVEHQSRRYLQLSSSCHCQLILSLFETDRLAQVIYFALSSAVYSLLLTPLCRRTGAPEGNRTPDPRLKRALLYQLSYWRIYWRQRTDSNHQLKALQACALPFDYAVIQFVQSNLPKLHSIGPLLPIFQLLI